MDWDPCMGQHALEILIACTAHLVSQLAAANHLPPDRAHSWICWASGCASRCIDAKATPWIIAASSSVLVLLVVLLASNHVQREMTRNEQGKGIPRTDKDSGGLRGSGVKTAEVKPRRPGSKFQHVVGEAS